jgi:hypothetical protein
MPGITDFTDISNMGVVLMSCRGEVEIITPELAHIASGIKSPLLAA